MAITVVKTCVRCSHVDVAHQAQGCRFNGCSCEAFDDGLVIEEVPAKRFPRVPVLGFSGGLESDGKTDIHRLIVGVDTLTLDGKQFPWSTVGEWVLKFSDDHLGTLTVSIAVSLPKDPEAVVDVE